MDTEGSLAPETPAEAREEYGALAPAAKVAVREAARAMEFDREEYAERVTGEVVGTVRDALFASLLRVHVGTGEEFDAWLDDHPGYEPDVAGSENVERVVWHPVPFAGEGGVAVAATFHDEREAALGTLRRRAFGRVYREHLPASGDGEGDAGPERGGPEA
ncbi:DUF5809 family protein [Halorarum salinum]|uniref:Uncharacterized protein n=1 Tax=Halorarum salinum TaxID=2743089 RepID=A0A7D5QF80_9EURY|nr:DUF5809 family protein [Halobaculum salinum]QLG61223.1 hypothetical protein HUG12_05530 [Halobaculum salinum]